MEVGCTNSRLKATDSQPGSVLSSPFPGKKVSPPSTLGSSGGHDSVFEVDVKGSCVVSCKNSEASSPFKNPPECLMESESESEDKQAIISFPSSFSPALRDQVGDEEVGNSTNLSFAESQAGALSYQSPEVDEKVWSSSPE